MQDELVVTCQCGKTYDVDPCTEKNLIRKTSILIAKCPYCGKLEKSKNLPPADIVEKAYDINEPKKTILLQYNKYLVDVYQKYFKKKDKTFIYFKVNNWNIHMETEGPL